MSQTNRSAGAAALIAALCGCYNFDQAAQQCVEQGICDAAPPAILSSSPAPLGTRVPVALELSVQFTEPMNPQGTTLSLGGVALANPVWDEDDSRVTVTPLQELAYSTDYLLSVAGEDKAGNPLTDAQIAFRTRGVPDVIPPELSTIAPGDGASANAKLAIVFTEAMDPTSLEVSVVRDPGLPTQADYDPGPPTWTGGDTRVDFLSPPSALELGHSYLVTVAGKDLDENVLSGTVEHTFATTDPPDTTAPTLVSSDPLDNATGVPLSSNLSFVFDEPMTASTTTTQVTLSPAATFVLTWYNDNTLLELNPSAALTGSTQYTVTLTTALKDGSPQQNALAAPVVIKFTTAAAPDTTPPTIVSVTSTPGAYFFRDTSVRVTFSEPMDKASTQAAFSIFSPNRSGTFAWSTDSTQMVFDPGVDFAYGDLVSWQFASGAPARDQAGNSLGYRSGTFKVLKQTTITRASTATLDGYTTKAPGGTASAINTDTYTYAGDSSTSIEYRGFVSFPLAITGMVKVRSATLTMNQSLVEGVPYASASHYVWAESVDYGSSFTGAAHDTPTLYDCSIYGCTGKFRSEYYFKLTGSSLTGDKAVAVTSAVENDRRDGRLRSQFRLRFSQLTANADTDYARFFLGTTSTTQPRLLIDYEYTW